MSLYLPEQKLGSHSTEGGSSNKFVLKGRQTGSMHRGHTWVFRAESHDTMMAWYEAIRTLTETTPQERNEFVRGHARSYSRSSQRSVSSDGGVFNDEDEEPFAVDAAAARPLARQESMPRRPSPGGRFPSDLEVNAARGLQAPLSPSSVSSGYDHETVAAAAALPGSGLDQHYGSHLSPSSQPQQHQHQHQHQHQLQHQLQQQRQQQLHYGDTAHTPLQEAPARGAVISHQAREDGVNPYTGQVLDGPPAPMAAATYAPAAAGLGRKPSTRIAQSPSLAAESSDGFDGETALTNGQGAAAQTVRPTKSMVRNDSVPTISNLHIPGGYPKGTPTG
jgi:hypothetical protein